MTCVNSFELVVAVVVVVIIVVVAVKGVIIERTFMMGRKEDR